MNIVKRRIKFLYIQPQVVWATCIYSAFPDTFKQLRPENVKMIIIGIFCQ